MQEVESSRYRCFQLKFNKIGNICTICSWHGDVSLPWDLPWRTRPFTERISSPETCIHSLDALQYSTSILYLLLSNNFYGWLKIQLRGFSPNRCVQKFVSHIPFFMYPFWTFFVGFEITTKVLQLFRKSFSTVFDKICTDKPPIREIALLDTLQLCHLGE